MITLQITMNKETKVEKSVLFCVDHVSLSVQIISSSHDDTILIWDFLDAPPKPGGLPPNGGAGDGPSGSGERLMGNGLPPVRPLNAEQERQLLEDDDDMPIPNPLRFGAAPVGEG